MKKDDRLRLTVASGLSQSRINVNKVTLFEVTCYGECRRSMTDGMTSGKLLFA